MHTVYIVELIYEALMLSLCFSIDIQTTSVCLSEVRELTLL